MELTMNIQGIALDLDGTTLYDSNTLSEGNRAALIHAISQGVQVIIASGRPFQSLPSAVMNLEGLRYAITTNGSEIYDLKTGECLRRVLMQKTVIEEILRITAEYPGAVIHETFLEGQAYAPPELLADPQRYAVKPEYVEYIRTTRIPVEDMTSFLRQQAGNYGNIDLIIPDPAIRKELTERLKASSLQFYLTSSVEARVEISGADAGKGGALDYLIQYRNWNREAVAAFGNADNDIEMLKTAGIGIAVADASENCLAAADAITKPCREDGVAWAFHNLLHLEEPSASVSGGGR